MSTRTIARNSIPQNPIPQRSVVQTTRLPALVPVGVVARRTVRGALAWGGVFALMAWMLVNEFANAYPTAADRATLVKTMGSDVGTQAIFGPAHHLDTVAGYFAFHVVAIFGIVGGAWGLLAGTRLVRGEEESGRWELVLTGQTTRRRATAAAIAGLGVGLFALWAAAAAATFAVGRNADPEFSLSQSTFTALAASASAAMFLALGALCSQLAGTRRQAAGLTALLLGIAYVLRVIAYSTSSLRWLHWVTPLGWVDEMRPLTDSRPLALLPILAFTLAVVGLTIWLSGRRDLGASVLRTRDTAPARTRLLTNTLGLTLRLDLRATLGWTAGLATGGLLMGMSARSIEDIWKDQSGGALQSLGGSSGSAAYLGLVFLIAGLLVMLAAAGQVAATREEEADGHADNLLTRPVNRLQWLADRLSVATAALIAFGIVIGLFTWLGAASSGASVEFSSLLAAGVNVVPGAVFVLGIGTLAHGLAPHFATVIAYGLVAWSFLLEFIGAGLGLSGRLLNLSIFHHVARAPAVDVDWGSAVTLIVLGLAAAAVGAIALQHRDLAGE